MRTRSFLRGFSFLLGCGAVHADQPPQGQVSFTAGASGTWNADWAGVSARTYFLQWSLDLTEWHYAPVVDFGTGIKSFGIATDNASKLFVRLRYVDDTTSTTLQQAKNADFDNDGIPNYYEVETLGTDPLDRTSDGGDSDSDGLTDGWELFYFGGLEVANPAAVLGGDGLTNKEKSELGLNPNTNYSAPNAAPATKFTYDLTGRLTGATAPVGTGAYVPDEEGNLLNAH